MGRTVEVSQFLSLLSNWEQLFAEKKKKKKKSVKTELTLAKMGCILDKQKLNV